MADTRTRMHYAILSSQRKRMPQDDVLAEAMARVRVYNRRAWMPEDTKPHVRVFLSKDGRRQTYVLHIGRHFVSGERWDSLVHNAAFGRWRRLETVTYWKRWK